MSSSDSTESSAGNSDHPRTSSTPLLVKLAHGSAPFISTFLLIHLSAPVLANIGGSSLSSNVMLLGREYYQTPFGEKYLLLTPLGIHMASGLARRLFASSPSKQPRKLTSPLTIAAYTVLILFPIHFYTHRVAPTDPSPPILSVGPAELDYEFVKTGLSRFPWQSWALYTGLVGGVLVHAVEGVNVIWTTWLGKRMSKRTKRIVVGAVAIPVMLGLWTLSREPLMALSSTVERYSASFAKLYF